MNNITPASPVATRLQALRTEMARQGYDGFLVPMADEYQSEYVPPSAQRIAFLTSFTGSSGFVVILGDKAAFFTDGRYTLQAQREVPQDLFTVFDSAVTTPSEWLTENLKAGRLAYDPWLHSEEGVERLKKALLKSEVKLVPVEHNLVDAIWHERPEPPAAPIYAHDMAYAGKSSADKRNLIAAELKTANIDAAVIADPASIAWLLNIRGGDVANTPLPLSFAILKNNGQVKWFVDQRKITGGLLKTLGPEIDCEQLGQFPHALDRLGMEERRVRVDPTGTSSWIIARLEAAHAKLDRGDDPSQLPRACKNVTELEGMRAAHRRDGAALVKFFAWLDKTIRDQVVTELDAEEKLSEFRKTNNLYRGPSFDTIAGSGAHGAIVHYRATKQTNKKLEDGTLFLLDSGGQYMDGTTDVTRTVAVGKPTGEMKDRFTRVLKGHIALASIRFPEGTTGAELDALARQFLWAAGVDYSHGTGHGVGSYLSVHEGPQAISKRSRVPLKPGMILSNEPGYYKTGAYGIRIENLQAVTDRLDIPGGERRMLGFEPLTLVPIDQRLIDPSLLSEQEKTWLNNYHTRVREVIRPLVDEFTNTWLFDATAAIW